MARLRGVVCAGAAWVMAGVLAFAGMAGCRSEKSAGGSAGGSPTMRAESGAAGKELLAAGVCDMVEPGGGGRSHRVRYTAMKDPETFECGLVLAMEAGDGSPAGGGVWRYALPVGQEHLRTMYPQYCGDRIGHVMAIKLGYGAGSLKTVLVGLDGKGGFRVVFSESARFDADIVDVTGDSVPEVCLFKGDLNTPNQTATVYEWDGKAFAAKRTIPVDRVHSYSLPRAVGPPGLSRGRDDR